MVSTPRRPLDLFYRRTVETPEAPRAEAAPVFRRMRVGPGRVSLLKIAVEGAEALVLGGIARTLAAHPPLRIVCQTPADSAAARMLLERGYSARPLDHRKTLFTAPDAG